MIIYLAGGESYYREIVQAYAEEIRQQGLKINQLASFYQVVRRGGTFYLSADKILLDSGAFSFLQSGKHIDWNEYVEKFIDFINQNKIELFFELDIDKLVGYERVKEIRRKIERGTNKPVIPVWHKRLGKEEFLRMCDEYNYVAIGGIVSREISTDEYKYFPAFIREAHKRGAKIHGLGFTNLSWLPKCHFDSVDSTTWTYCTRAGNLYFFDEQRGTILLRKVPQGKRARNDIAPAHNFIEWVKFANYAERNL